MQELTADSRYSILLIETTRCTGDGKTVEKREKGVAIAMREGRVILKEDVAAEFFDAVHSRQPVLGLTHSFYRYPARFSPLFARTAIKAFTQPGDLVLDPFVGGGTTLVEACVLGRHAIGADISELAVFVTRVKTTPLSDEDLSTIHGWADGLSGSLNLRNPPIRATKWIEEGYQRNISDKNTWPIRKTLELALAQTGRLPYECQQNFVRCALLKTGQWALDCRRTIPSAREFRRQFFANLQEMSEGAKEFSTRALEADNRCGTHGLFRPLCLNRSIIGIDSAPKLADVPAPKLILTSPPYPGVHVLYHRWQVQGRKETPAPFWIANCIDGYGASFYTFGHREQPGLTNYYDQISKAFASLARIADHKTLLVQVVAFSDPTWQFPRYLQIMKQAGFTEVKLFALANSSDGRLWRRVPNRKWYAHQRGTIPSSKEVVLFHCLAQA